MVVLIQYISGSSLDPTKRRTLQINGGHAGIHGDCNVAAAAAVVSIA